MPKLTSIPTIQEINSANYVLLVAIDLCDDAGFCLPNSIKAICSLRALGGKPIDFARTIALCRQMKFLIQSASGLVLTSSARQFVALNQNQTYEIHESQKYYLVGNMVFQGAWESHTRGFFLNFSPNYESFTFELSTKDNPLPKSYSALHHLLKNLGVIEDRLGVIYVKPSYVRNVKDILSKRKGLTQEQLEKLLNADEDLGTHAEQAVLQYEQKRLTKMGRLLEAELVKRISQLDATAGYDIASFDGEFPTTNHNRFIEVKASKKKMIRFYWSGNEYDKAKKLGEKYWIYFVGNFSKDRPTEIKPVMIQDPANRLREFSELSIKVAKYLVEEVDNPNE